MTRTGIVLYHGIDSGPELAGYGRMAEDAGFDSLWVTERYFHLELLLLSLLSTSLRGPSGLLLRRGGNSDMKCSINGCSGEYEARRVFHALKHEGRIIVIDQVPADVCTECDDVLLDADTVRRIEDLLRQDRQPATTVPLRRLHNFVIPAKAGIQRAWMVPK